MSMRKLILPFAALFLFAIPALAQKAHLGKSAAWPHPASHGPKAYKAPAHPAPTTQGHSEKAGHPDAPHVDVKGDRWGRP